MPSELIRKKTCMKSCRLHQKESLVSNSVPTLGPFVTRKWIKTGSYSLAVSGHKMESSPRQQPNTEQSITLDGKGFLGGMAKVPRLTRVTRCYCRVDKKRNKGKCIPH
ncbi:hypothetical protein Btru_039967 [Bulinus truncatus]|nr:hypothetical protein Btru_039967 [Bulinus truncatus]